MLLGNLFARDGDHAKAESHLSQAMKLAESSDDIKLLAPVLGNAANAYAQAGKLKLAINLYTRQLTLLTELSDQTNTIKCQNNLATAYLDTKQYQQAKDLLTSNLPTAKAMADLQSEAHIYKNLFFVYQGLNDATAAHQILTKYKELTKQWHDDKEHHWANDQLKKL